MADWHTNGILRYDGTPPSKLMPFLNSTSSNAGFTFTDSNGASSSFESGDAITEPFVFPGPYDYEGTVSVPLQAGGTVQALVVSDGTETLVVLPTGVQVSTVSISGTFDGSTVNTAPVTECFAAGTLIDTPSGAVAVEELRIGDPILRAEGGQTSVLWIGRQTVYKAILGERMQPVRFRAGALGGGLPQTDLTVTADHGMVIDGYVINASVLVNGTTIDWVPMAELSDSFTVYHVETEAHDVILANGAPSETLLDNPGRAAFDNYQEYLDLYGLERIIPEMRADRITSRRLLPEKIKARLGILAKPDADFLLTA